MNSILVSPIHGVYINSKAAHSELLLKEYDRLNPYFIEKVSEYMEVHNLPSFPVRPGDPDPVPSVLVEGLFWATLQYQARREKDGTTMFKMGTKVKLRGMGGLIKYGIVVADERGYEIEAAPFTESQGKVEAEPQDVRIDNVRIVWYYANGTVATPHGAWANPLLLEELQ